MAKKRLPHKLALTVEVSEVELQGDDAGFEPYYSATLHINGTPHHLAIFPVEEREVDDKWWGKGKMQHAARGHDDWYEALQAADCRDGGIYQTIDIAGRPFVALVTPFME